MFVRNLVRGSLLCTALLAAMPATVAAQATSNAPPVSEVTAQAVIPIVDSGWSTATSSSDCATGMGDDSWELTLTEAKRLTVSVQDCCCPGDYFEVFVNGDLIGTTPNLAPPWGCDFSGPNSSGSFTVPLCPGTHSITVRDAGFDGHSLSEIEDQNMCPAGFTVSGSLASPASSVAPITLARGTPATGSRRPAPPVEPRAQRLRKQVEDLTPFITQDSRGLQHLQVEEARRQGISPATLNFGHRMVALNNRVIIAALQDREPNLSDKDFEFIEPYFNLLAQQGDPCTDRDHPAACPARVASGLCFATREEAVAHLEANGFHRTANYAGGASGNDYTGIAAFSGCSTAEAFRDHAIIRMMDSYWTYSVQGPEPNPEVLSYIFSWPYVSWPGYVRWWHRVYC